MIRNDWFAGVIPRSAWAEEDPADDRHQTESDGRMRRRQGRIAADQKHQPEFELPQSRAVRRRGKYRSEAATKLTLFGVVYKVK